MAAESKDVSAGLRVEAESSPSGGEGEIHVGGQEQAAASKTAESYVGPPPRVYAGSSIDKEEQDAVLRMGDEQWVPMGSGEDTNEMGYARWLGDSVDGKIIPRYETGGPVHVGPTDRIGPEGRVYDQWGREKFAVGDPNSTARGSGARANGGKVRMDLVPLHLLADCGAVFDYGTRKYAPWNWAKGMAWSIPYACMVRHLAAWYRGEDLDPESGISHLGHVMCNLLMLEHYKTAYQEGDDRPAREFQEGGIK